MSTAVHSTARRIPLTQPLIHPLIPTHLTATNPPTHLFDLEPVYVRHIVQVDGRLTRRPRGPPPQPLRRPLARHTHPPRPQQPATQPAQPAAQPAAGGPVHGVARGADQLLSKTGGGPARPIAPVGVRVRVRVAVRVADRARGSAVDGAVKGLQQHLQLHAAVTRLRHTGTDVQ
jgi:hypothetical protein